MEKIKVVSAQQLEDGAMEYMVDATKGYSPRAISTGGEITRSLSFKKSRYRSYTHFVGVMGKFNPYTHFFKSPVEVEETYKALKEIAFVEEP